MAGPRDSMSSMAATRRAAWLRSNNTSCEDVVGTLLRLQLSATERWLGSEYIGAR